MDVMVLIKCLIAIATSNFIMETVCNIYVMNFWILVQTFFFSF